MDAATSFKIVTLDLEDINESVKQQFAERVLFLIVSKVGMAYDVSLISSWPWAHDRVYYCNLFLQEK